MFSALSSSLPDTIQGLIDAHGHPLLYGYYSQLPLAGSKSVQEVITRVEQFVTSNYSSLPAGAWVEGMGWDQNIWDPKEYPTAVSELYHLIRSPAEEPGGSRRITDIEGTAYITTANRHTRRMGLARRTGATRGSTRPH